MPSGLPPVSEDELEALRLWIYAGAPEDGVVDGVQDLRDACLPDPTPIEIKPLAPPAADEGIQFRMPEFLLPARSETEVCFAQYFDLGATTVSLLYEAATIGNASYTFSGDLNGDGGTSNDLIYIPRNTSEMNFEQYSVTISGVTTTFTSQQQADAWEPYIKQDKYLSAHPGPVSPGLHPGSLWNAGP